MNMVDKTYKIKFENHLKGEFIDSGKFYTREGKRTFVEDVLKEPFLIKSGQTKEIDQKTYDYLKKKTYY
jgi:hypothetical protein